MLLQQSVYSNITGTGSQVTPGFPHSQFRLRVASPKVREHGRTMPICNGLAPFVRLGPLISLKSTKYQRQRNAVNAKGRGAPAAVRRSTQ